MHSEYISTPPRYNSLADSGLWRRLEQFPDPEVKDLAVKVDKVARASATLLNQVARYMPFYTLHDERHVLNVLGWMERLLGVEGIPVLSPLECALAILSAYLHDVGMTLSADEHRNIVDEESVSQDRQDFASFSDRYVEERHLIDQLRRRGQNYRGNLIQDHILTDFLRTTHADERSERIKHRLTEIERNSGDTKLFEFRRLSFREALGFIATSHNQPVTWLREKTEKELGGFSTTIGTGEPVNFGFIGLLLRLADIMDFDPSRTPTILFHHIGLDQELASQFEEISRQEWMKHLSISGVDWPEGGSLTYRSQQCPHPAIEKSIRQFVGWIKEEVSGARPELGRLQTGIASDRRLRMNLPEDVAVSVWPERRNGQPVYEYHDWRFELDQQEVLRLLMGEALYGNPNLCIRELLQNALDAVELRDLRLQLIERGGQPCEPVDGVFLRPGWFKFAARDEELEVRLTWGEHEGNQFIRVEDNGVGMTRETIQRYFTRIGKSYYQSPESRRERSEMHAKGLLLTPISEFGIGVLSCFMIADRVTVRTHPGRRENQSPIDLEISGPSSLFWIKPGTRDRQGTEVTLWLRKSNLGGPVKLVDDWEVCRRELRRLFRYEAGGEEIEGLAPGVVAARYVVWPKYPVCIQNWKCRIDDRFHLDHLCPLSTDQLTAHAKHQGISRDYLGRVKWAAYDWIDNDGREATGTRIRLWFPQWILPTSAYNLPGDPPAGSLLMPFWMLASLVEGCLDDAADARTLTLVQGMLINNTGELLSVLPLCHGIGSRMWADFRGKVKPQLTVNRFEALSSPDWTDQAKRVLDRCIADIVGSLPSEHSFRRNMLLFSWQNRTTISRTTFDVPMSATLVPNTSGRGKDDLVFLLRGFLQAVTVDKTLGPNPSYCTAQLARDRSLAAGLPANLSLPSLLNAAEYRKLAIILARAAGGELPEFPETAPNADTHLRMQVLGALLQHSFFPDLGRSWSVLDLFELEGHIGNARLTAPGSFRFELSGRCVEFQDTLGKEPYSLTRFGYDLCFPMSSIPLGRLREKFPMWREDRRWGAVGVLPFLFPESVEEWGTFASQSLKVLSALEYLFAFSPTIDLWFKPFSEWTDTDWLNDDNRSYLWAAASNEVLVAQGAVSVDQMRRKGQRYSLYRASSGTAKS